MIQQPDTSDTDDSLAKLLNRERDRQHALMTDDMERFAALLADALVHVHTTGIVHDKAQLIQHAGQFLRFHSVERGPLIVVLLAPGAAVMTGEMTNIVGRRGTEERVTVRSFVTQLWVQQDAWRLLRFQATRLPEATGPAS
jgi:hypothetical protein